jgi:AbrB family looped-hinge helix DNA binding protein
MADWPGKQPCWSEPWTRLSARIRSSNRAQRRRRGPRWYGAWYINGMRTAIDSAGRVVIPKALRDALGLTAGQPLEIAERDGRLEIVPAATPMRLIDEGGGVAAVAGADMPVLTADMVRDTLERIRR